jgi:hypothetical protein
VAHRRRHPRRRHPRRRWAWRQHPRRRHSRWWHHTVSSLPIGEAL